MRFRVLIKGTPFVAFMKGLPSFLREYGEFRRQAGDRPEFPFRSFYPCLEDRRQESGIAAGHYFHQDLLVAGRICFNKPARHVDVGSRIDGLVAHIASFRPVEVLDIRNLKSSSGNIIFHRADLMAADFGLVDYCDSLSCLHALEHFGLGRYGDRIDYEGHLTGWKNMYRMLRKGGKLYFSVPIGEQRIEFNAHRVFSLPYLLKMMEGRYRLDAFSYVDDEGELVPDPDMDPAAIEKSFSCRYGCGIFELTKL